MTVFSYSHTCRHTAWRTGDWLSAGEGRDAGKVDIILNCHQQGRLFFTLWNETVRALHRGLKLYISSVNEGVFVNVSDP